MLQILYNIYIYIMYIYTTYIYIAEFLYLLSSCRWNQKVLIGGERERREEQRRRDDLLGLREEQSLGCLSCFRPSSVLGTGRSAEEQGSGDDLSGRAGG
jgi:hypothetical protein